MTLPNKITLIRILLVPVFVLMAVYYGSSVRDGRPDEHFRYAAIALFLAAALSDGLDGWLARRFRLKSALGAVLDPIADKGLMLAAIVTLSLAGWPHRLPLWYPVLVISRDAIILIGCGILYFLNGGLEVSPSRMGKLSTFLQMAAVSVVMLQWGWYAPVVWASGAATLISGIAYVGEGVRLLQAGGHGAPIDNNQPQSS